MDFPKAGTEKDILMQLTIGFQVVGQTESDSDKQYVLKLNKNIHGIKQGSFNWYKNFKK